MTTNFIISVILICFLLLGVPRVITGIYAKNRIFNKENIPSTKVAIVFGAGLQRDGTPTAVLKDRVATAAELYKEKKISKILMSGDNRFENYNEPGAMFSYAVSLGVPPTDITLDYAGRRTYDTCFRASHIFGLKNAILVTQNYHLPRALYTCNLLGIQSVGIAADRRHYSSSAKEFWKIREIPATLGAIWDLWVSHPLPVLGDPEYIYENNGGTVGE